MLVVAPISGSPQSAQPKAGDAPKTHTVTIEDMRFNPEVLTVKRADQVAWLNKDLFPHTATAGAKAFDSGTIDANASWTYVAGEPGDYAYFCRFHPTMHGRLVVR